jgi:hypothetical protein
VGSNDTHGPKEQNEKHVKHARRTKATLKRAAFFLKGKHSAQKSVRMKKSVIFRICFALPAFRPYPAIYIPGTTFERLAKIIAASLLLNVEKSM